MTYSCGGTADRCKELTLATSFFARLRRAKIPGMSFTGGCALRAYPRLRSLHRSAVRSTNV